MANLISDISLLFQRITWLGLFDILLVTLIFYVILNTLQDTQAMVLLRGILFLIIVLGLVTSIFQLPALSWLLRTALPALIFSIPVIFAPEIRRALEKIGRTRFSRLLFFSSPLPNTDVDAMIAAVVSACIRLADHQYGALIILQRQDKLTDYINTGVKMDARISAELLMQVFYPNTPLHDGASVVVGDRLAAAGCVMPLSNSKTLNQSPERESGLRHRAALGTAEVSDAIALVVSEETGTISLANHNRLLKRISAEKLENYLRAFYNQDGGLSLASILAKLEHRPGHDKDENA
jgi:diadenylate cyclase